MRYFKFLTKYSGSHGTIVCRAGERYGIGQNDVFRGQWIRNWDERITYYFNPGTGGYLSDLLAENLGWLVFSPRFKAILDELGVGGIQYLPVRLENQLTEEVIEGWNVANIVNVVDAVDLEHSYWHSVSDGPNKWRPSIIKYALFGDRVGDNDIFRVIEDSFWGVSFGEFVSERVMKAIKKNKITGCSFLEVPVY